MKKEHPEWDQKQCVAVCYSIWRRSKESDNTERVLLHLNAPLDTHVELVNEQGDSELSIDRCTILVGDKSFNGIYFPTEELEKAFFSWNKQPINLDHSDMVENIVGHVDEPFFDKVQQRITVKPVIGGYSKSQIALDYIHGRLRAGSIPEVSVGVWCDKNEEDINGETVLVARNLQGDHLALVTRGACSPQDGCGIGLRDEPQVGSDEIEHFNKEILKEKIKQQRLLRLEEK